MKVAGFLLILLVGGFVLGTGCVLKPAANATVVPTAPVTTIPTATTTFAPFNPTPVPVLGNIPEGIPFGRLNVSIGSYNALLPVYVDNMSAGQVSAGKILNLKVGEGMHSVKVCSGAMCEMVMTEIRAGVSTSMDFGTLLDTDAPQGTLNVSIGDYPGDLPVLVDNASAGNVSPGKFLIQVLSGGLHTVKICNADNCISENVTIESRNETSVDFGDQLKNDISQGSLSISIGGFEGTDLPVLLDNIRIGNVSQGKPLNVKLNQGNHTVKVCSGTICESEDVQVKFAKQSSVDFGDRLKADIEFPTPTVLITSSVLSGQDLTIEVGFINPDTVDHTMSATISCVYSYVDGQNIRRNDVRQKRVTVTVARGKQANQEVYLYLGGGTNVIANDPVVVDVAIK